jgi:hypothetical protein
LRSDGMSDNGCFPSSGRAMQREEGLRCQHSDDHFVSTTPQIFAGSWPPLPEGANGVRLPELPEQASEGCELGDGEFLSAEALLCPLVPDWAQHAGRWHGPSLVVTGHPDTELVQAFRGAPPALPLRWLEPTTLPVHDPFPVVFFFLSLFIVDFGVVNLVAKSRVT